MYNLAKWLMSARKQHACQTMMTELFDRLVGPIALVKTSYAKQQGHAPSNCGATNISSWCSYWITYGY